VTKHLRGTLLARGPSTEFSVPVREWFAGSIAPRRVPDMSANIRAIHIVPSIAEEASGPSYTVVRLCESLVARGTEVTLATLDWPPVKSPPAFLRTFPMGIGPRRLGRSPAMKRWLTQQSHTVDLFHSHSLWMMPNVYPGLVGRRTGTRTIVSPRGTLSTWSMRSGSPLKRFFWPLLQQPALAAATCFHATSETEYEDIRRSGFHQPVAIIPNGVDIPDAQAKPPTDRRTLLFLGRIHPKKGVDVLLRAWGAVQDKFPEWRLRVVGPDSGGHLTKMLELAKELCLDRTTSRARFAATTNGARTRGRSLCYRHIQNFGMTVAESSPRASGGRNDRRSVDKLRTSCRLVDRDRSRPARHLFGRGSLSVARFARAHGEAWPQLDGSELFVASNRSANDGNVPVADPRRGQTRLRRRGMSTQNSLMVWRSGPAPVAVVMISLNGGTTWMPFVVIWPVGLRVFLVDSFSQDDTVDIALRHGVHSYSSVSENWRPVEPRSSSYPSRRRGR
jgi:hypothetical protein